MFSQNVTIRYWFMPLLMFDIEIYWSCRYQKIINVISLKLDLSKNIKNQIFLSRFMLEIENGLFENVSFNIYNL